MSNYGRHCVLTKAEARAMLPVGACKMCVYWTRVWGHPGYGWPCDRCGAIGRVFVPAENGIPAIVVLEPRICDIWEAP